VRLIARPSGGPLRGLVRMPGDKSVTHRALLLAALAEGESVLSGVNPGADCRHVAQAVRALGAGVRRTGSWQPASGLEPAGGHGPAAHGDAPGYVIRGVGGRWSEPAGVLDLGNSGTGLRLLAGAVAGHDILCVLDGDASLRRRPMARIAEPLRRMGARVDGRSGGALAPLVIRGAALRGAHHVSPVASAQVKSALLLAGLAAAGETRVTEPRASRDHTERLLPVFGARLLPPAPAGQAGHSVGLAGPQALRAASLAVPGDFSSAAFWIVAALVVPGSEITLAGVGLNPGRTGLLRALARMGAAIEARVTGDQAGEPVGEVRVQHSPLAATDVGAAEVPDLIDELPVWAVACAFAEGVSTLSGAAELRAKESDRLAGVARGLTALGGQVEERPDGLVIRGGGAAGAPGGGLRGGHASAAADHRLAMAFLVAGLGSPGGAEVTGCEAIDTSYPAFYPTLTALASFR
jgi:3-phosphoshikimate 1-carboxyvinyltransferase